MISFEAETSRLHSPGSRRHGTLAESRGRGDRRQFGNRSGDRQEAGLRRCGGGCPGPSPRPPGATASGSPRGSAVPAAHPPVRRDGCGIGERGLRRGAQGSGRRGHPDQQRRQALRGAAAHHATGHRAAGAPDERDGRGLLHPARLPLDAAAPLRWPRGARQQHRGPLHLQPAARQPAGAQHVPGHQARGHRPHRALPPGDARVQDEGQGHEHQSGIGGHGAGASGLQKAPNAAGGGCGQCHPVCPGHAPPRPGARADPQADGRTLLGGPALLHFPLSPPEYFSVLCKVPGNFSSE